MRYKMAKNRNKKLRQDKGALSSASQKQGLYSSLKINNFRIFDELELHDLGKINLFFGPNNSGKTSILEAIFTHACGLNIIPALRHTTLTRQDGQISGHFDFGEKILNLFKNKDRLPLEFSVSAKVGSNIKDYILKTAFWPSYELANLDPLLIGQPSMNYAEHKYDDNTINQIAKNEYSLQAVKTLHIGEWNAEFGGKSHKFVITFPLIREISLQPFKLGVMSDILSHRQIGADLRIFSYLKRYGKIAEFTAEMQQAFKEIHEIDMIPYPDGQNGMIYIEISDNQRIPLHVFGDGMRRWFFLLGQMIVYQNAVHCIEEIDSTFHPGAHALLSKLLVNYAEKFENQLFLTSHSIEFTDAFLNALYGENGVIIEKNDDPVRIFTLGHSQENKTEIWSLSGREAFEKRQKFGLDLRG
ncbi:MAG TPA: hypothetical protein DCQ37_16400 [Desulfobacteraceae bacterium]|nr:hypothetical protein [Desulfobacteraceae bacterium]